MPNDVHVDQAPKPTSPYETLTGFGAAAFSIGTLQLFCSFFLNQLPIGLVGLVTIVGGFLIITLGMSLTSAWEKGRALVEEIGQDG